jgi:hypothetical protein
MNRQREAVRNAATSLGVVDSKNGSERLTREKTNPMVVPWFRGSAKDCELKGNTVRCSHKAPNP